jgi:hypothetical protein
MTRSILKPIIAGILLGTAAFFMPFFILKAILFIFIIGTIFRAIMWRRHYWGKWQYIAYTDKIRNMSEEEYKEFKDKMNNWNHNCCDNKNWNWRNCDSKENCETTESK